MSNRSADSTVAMDDIYLDGRATNIASISKNVDSLKTYIGTGSMNKARLLLSF